MNKLDRLSKWWLIAALLGCAAESSTTDLPMASSSAALELVSVSPEAAAPLWVRSPIVLRFSAAVDAASASTGVRLDSDPGPVTVTQRVAGEVVTLEIAAPPLAPSTLTLSVTADLRDSSGRPALPTSRSWQLPLWRTQAADGASAQAPKLAHARGVTWLAWASEASIQLAEYTDQGYQPITALPVEAGAHLSDLVIDAQGKPVVAWSGSTAHVARWAAAGWQPLEAGLDTAIAPGVGPQLALGDQDAIAVAWPTAAGLELFSWSAEGPWQRLAPVWQPTAAAPATIHASDLTWSIQGAVLAVLVEQAGTRDLQVHRLESGVWRTLSEALEHKRSDDVRALAIDAAPSGDLIAAWIEVTDGVDRLYASRFSDAAGSFQALGPALNVGLENSVGHPALAAGDATAPVVAFQEQTPGGAATYVARWNGSGFRVLGGSLGARIGPALALGRYGEPMAAIARAADGGIELQHYNESPQPPFGLRERKPQPCTLPPDSDPAFPRRLSATGCYAELATQTLAEGWIPYDLNSPLWSDGADKRRFFSIPDNTTIGFTEVDAWEVPIGTVLGKEFWLRRDPADPSSRYIVETRLMIKRCEPGSCRASWQGYSYQWSATGDEATLLDNTSQSVYVDWPVAGGTHKHTYPARDECTRCHALSAGGALGLRTPQLNRNHRYAHAVDHQLRALFQAGLFGNTEAPANLDSLLRLPTPSEPYYDLNAQVRGYFDANCSHCHSPTSRWPVIDLRYDSQPRSDDGTGTTGNICNMLVPGNADASILYVKLKAVPGQVPEGFPGDTMPPIGRLLPDEAQLPRIKAWIDGMAACP